jgi:hypothetical protein
VRNKKPAEMAGLGVQKYTQTLKTRSPK